MIIMTMNSGPHSGVGRTFEGYDNEFASCNGQPVNVHELLVSCAQNGWRWKIIYTQATETEIIGWGTAELVGLILLAFVEKRPVHFSGQIYTQLEEAGLLEDAIASSGQMVTVERDDSTGLWIMAGKEEPLID